MVAYAYSLLDSYIYGSALQEASLPFETAEETAEQAGKIMARFRADEDPHLTELTIETSSSPATTTAASSSSRLDLILDGLERVRDAT